MELCYVCLLRKKRPQPSKTQDMTKADLDAVIATEPVELI